MMFSLALEMNSKLRGKLGALPFPGLRAFTPVFAGYGRGGTRGSREIFQKAWSLFESK